MKKKRGKKILKIICIILVSIFVMLFLFLLLWPRFGKAPSKTKQEEYAKRTKLFYDGIFHNEEPFEIMIKVPKSQRVDSQNKYPKEEIPVEVQKKIEKATKQELKVMWFGHSTSMLQMEGMNILMDPVFNEISSPIDFVGAKRMSKLPMETKDLPNIDIVLISHDHYDHLDYKTIKQIDSKVKQYIVPLGVENHLIRFGVKKEKIKTMVWWDDIQINELKISMTPGRHYSGRLPWEKYTSLWGGYVLNNHRYQVYYTGDTGYGKLFQQIYDKYGKMDLVLAEDGQYDPRWPYLHMNPEEVAKAMSDVHAKWVIPVHWAGFVLSTHAFNDPVIRLKEAAKNQDFSVATLKIGQIVDYNNIENYQQDWWERIE